ncbi:MAG: MG2 domain-containing protein [Treponema sp.]|nr:MG2 domain-containing protein [Treponema sp.]
MKTPKKLSGFFAVSVITALVCALSVSCNGKISPNPEHVAAVSGVINRNDPIIVEFTNSHDTSVPLPSNVFAINHGVKGITSWHDEYTLVFRPSQPLRTDKRYKVRVNIAGIPSFDFFVRAALPVLSVEFDPVRLDDNNEISIGGTLSFSEDIEISKIERVVNSAELGKPEWRHDNGEHRFVFSAIKRGEASRTAEITWNGTPLGVRENGFTTVMIPGRDNFELIGLDFKNGIIEASFSGNIKANQDLRGFISLSGNTDIRYSLEGNIIRIFGDDSGVIPAGAELVIQDLEDIEGKRLNTPVNFTAPSNWELPEVRFTGSGTILPTSQNAQLVIETKNVSGILIEAFQIYNHNMNQFLQVNNLSGTEQLDRVGEPVWKKAFDFQWAPQDQNRWVRRGLDMGELSRRFPGGMFHIRISFRHRHIRYTCSANHGNFSNLEFPNDNFIPYTSENKEYSGWDYDWGIQMSVPGYDYNQWHRHRNDPCHPAFYTAMNNNNITKSRNVLVSDLGLHAKQALDGSWLIAATNLLTARPVPNADYRILNFQGRVLQQGRTNANGLAVVPASPDTARGTRLVITAENSLGRAYLKVNDSLALSVSHFDIAGGTPTTGIRGLIYGERDVWRPGDDVFLTFLLSDPQGTLPANHPVSFELEDSRGRPVISRTFTTSVDGFYPITFSTASDAPTGDWTAKVRVGGSTFNRNIKIETVMPNRLKMDLNFGADEVIRSGSRRVPLQAEWLYGAPASGLRADVSVGFSDRETVFAGFSDFTFRDPSRSVSSERQNIWEGTLDNNGSATFTMNLNPGRSVPGKVTARFMTRVFEPSGVFSSEQVSREYSPYTRYVGIKLPRGDAARNMLLTDTDHPAEIVILNEDGRPVQGNVTLDCAIYKLNWRWWWERGGGESAEFAQSLSRNPISRQSVNVTNGRGTFNFRVNYPDWGRYLVLARDSSGGHAAAQIVYIDWPGWAGRAQEGGQGAQAMLALTAGKQSYSSNERVQITFPSNRNAAALVVIEKGGNVIRSEWINCQEGTTRYEFAAEPLMVPNIYVHVTLIQPHMQTQNDLPIRLYGVTPVLIEDTRMTLSPQIRTQNNWEAESRVSFTVSEASGRPMAYTVAVVDEGLLGLTRFTLPNPRNTFYARDASFLRSWDLFREIIGAYSGRLETLLAIGGGGGDGDNVDANKETQRFKPVVRFFGPFEIPRGGSKTETFDLPPYIGAVRIMVLAASSTSEPQTGRSLRAYGTAESTVRVTSDLMVFASLPRVLSPDDEVDIPVYVNSLRDESRAVRVNLNITGGTIQGPSSQVISFDRSEEKLVRFKMKAPSSPGNIQFTISAESPRVRTARQVVDMEVRSTAIPVTTSAQNLISPGDTWRGNINYPGRDGTNSLVVSFSRLPPLNMESRLGFLINYPHGCLEQTTSAAFPQLYLDKVLQLDDDRKAQIRTNIDAGIERVLSMQLSSGGFSYWPGESAVNDWTSSYAGHFIVEARRAGYQVRESAVRDWVNFQKNTASQWQASSRRFAEQAYRLFTLALAGEADIGSMNRLRSNTMPVQATWRLAAAYWHAGQRDIARTMTRDLALPTGDYRELSQTFGSSLRDKAMVLETLVLLTGAPGATQGDVARTRSLFDEISGVLSSEQWLSTQETAYALLAMSPYVQNNASRANVTLDFSAAGQTRNITFGNPSAEHSFGRVTGTSSAFTVTNRSSAPVYVRYTARGLPAEGREPALAAGLSLNVEYRDSNNNIIPPNNLRLGNDMSVIVRVRNTSPRTLEEVALIVPVPASWEIVNTRIGGGSSSSNFRYQDIRDDRVMTYFNLNRNEERTFRFTVNRAYDGSFFRPAIHAYAMYDESIRAVIPGAR